MTLNKVFDTYIAGLEDVRADFQRRAMNAKLDVDERMAMGHKAHRLREIIRQAKKHALELGEG